MNIVPTTEEVNKLPEPSVLNEEQIARVLAVSSSLKKFIDDVEAYALKQIIENGVSYEGFKVVEGRTLRKLVNTDELIQKLREDGYQDAAIFKAPEIETLTNLEKVVGKKAFTEKYSAFIDKPAGKPTLAPISDKRPAMVFITAQDDFAEDLE